MQDAHLYANIHGMGCNDKLNLFDSNDKLMATVRYDEASQCWKVLTEDGKHQVFLHPPSQQPQRLLPSAGGQSQLTA
jgi:hypothetical protein